MASVGNEDVSASAGPFEPAPDDTSRTHVGDELRAALQQVARLQDTLAMRQRQIGAMHRVSEAMFQQLNADVMARQTLDIALEVLEANAGSLQLYDPLHDTLVFQHVVGPAAATLSGYVMPASEGISGQVLRTGVPDVTQRVREHGGFNPMLGLNRLEDSPSLAEVMVTVPVKRPMGDPIGVMQLLKATPATSTTQSDFDRGDVEVLQVLCAQAAAAIEAARLGQQARQAEIAGVIGDVSHDIKNMLTPVQSGLWSLEPMIDQLFIDLDAIRERAQEREVAVALERAMEMVRENYSWMFSGALEACDRVQERTRDIADAVKGEIAPPFFEEADLNETVQEVARPLFMLADKTNVHLHLDLDLSLPRAAFDRKQMYNALYNLVNNAIPETPSGGSVTIRTRGPGADDGLENSLLLEVEDTGRGIPEHVRARLFTDQAVSTKAGGTGLGTRIVADVVRRHHGSIAVRSAEGHGSTFSIRLPLHHVDRLEPGPQSQRLPARRHNLSPPATALLGRESECAQARALLHNGTRLLTLTGPGGIGKTRLALQIASDTLDDFADGVWVISLASADNPTAVALSLAATLGVREEPGRDLGETLLDYLRSRRVLLVLDNFEQVIEAAPFVADALSACPDLKLLVTSRSALRLPEEQEMPLLPLALPVFERTSTAFETGEVRSMFASAHERPLAAEVVAQWRQCAAIALFVERAAQVQPGFELSPDNARDVAEICTRLDGLPLAIELAAAHSRQFAPAAMRLRLSNRLDSLQTDQTEAKSPSPASAAPTPARHQTLRTTMDWSYDLLAAPQQCLLRRLMVFEGGCTLEAARVICNSEHDLGLDVVEGLAHLVDKSLLRRSQRFDGEQWYCVLETIHEYGMAKLEAAGEDAQARRRHAAHYLDLAESAQAQRVRSPLAPPRLAGVPAAGATQAVWLDWRKREDGNLRAALRYLLDNESSMQDILPPYGALRLALALRDVWVGTYWNERREALQHALERSPDAPPEMHLKAMLYVGDLACLQADYAPALAFGDKALELSRRMEDHWGIGRALGILANVAMEQDDLDKARALHEESLALYETTSDQGAVAWALYHLGVLGRRAGDGEARARFERSLAIFRDMNDQSGVAWSLHNLGLDLYDHEQPQHARRLLEEALGVFREIENKSGIAWSLCFLGKVDVHARDFSLARAHLEESLHLARQLGDRWNICAALTTLGDLALASGDQDAARGFLRDAAALLEAMPGRPRWCDLVQSFARLAVTQGEMRVAARLLGAFDALSYNRSEIQMDDASQERDVTLARGVLGEHAFAECWAQGRAFSLQQALEEALLL